MLSSFYAHHIYIAHCLRLTSKSSGWYVLTPASPASPPPTLTRLTCTDTVLILSAYSYPKKRKKGKTDFVVNTVMHFFTYIPCIWILSKFYYSPTDAQVNCLKGNFKICIKTAPTCFAAVTPSSGSVLLVLAHISVW
jgi:hypothetical protein